MDATNLADLILLEEEQISEDGAFSSVPFPTPSPPLTRIHSGIYDTLSKRLAFGKVRWTEALFLCLCPLFVAAPHVRAASRSA